MHPDKLHKQKLTKPEHVEFHLLVVKDGDMVTIEFVVIAQKCSVINYHEMTLMVHVLNIVIAGKEFVMISQNK